MDCLLNDHSGIGTLLLWICLICSQSCLDEKPKQSIPPLLGHIFLIMIKQYSCMINSALLPYLWNVHNGVFLLLSLISCNMRWTALPGLTIWHSSISYVFNSVYVSYFNQLFWSLNRTNTKAANIHLFPGVLMSVIPFTLDLLLHFSVIQILMV